MAQKHKREYQVLYQPVDCRWYPGNDVNSFRETNPDKPTRADNRRHRRLLDMLLSAGDVVTARKIVGAHPYLRDYEDKIRQCAKEFHRQETQERLRRLRQPYPTPYAI
jgi:hypothetical protein